MTEASREDAFIATYVGCKPVVSRGGYVFSFVVPFGEADGAGEVLGGAWQPDQPVTVGITRIKNATIVE
jgi:hypothetical protein